MTHMTQSKLDGIERKILRAEVLLTKAQVEAGAAGSAYWLEMELFRAIDRTRVAHTLVNDARRSNHDCGTHITFNGQRPRYAPKPAPIATLGEVKP